MQPIHLETHFRERLPRGKNPNVSPITGIIQSFYDAPGGLKEELAEWTISPAIEYWYNKLFSIRAGYFYENVNKGDRKFFTVGAGLRYNVFGLDFSYLIPVKNNNPLQNTMQFTLYSTLIKLKTRINSNQKIVRVLAFVIAHRIWI